MFEKVNPSHPDKIADRIAGALVDYAYAQASFKNTEPQIAVEVLIGHSNCYIITESSIYIPQDFVESVVNRITNSINIYNVILNQNQQDIFLHDNQMNGFHCGDNGIFKGVPLSVEEIKLTKITNEIYSEFPTDGKYILDKNNLTICQSKLYDDDIEKLKKKYNEYNLKINPLGFWTGGPNVDSGVTNRKLGSDMGQSVTGGGLHGKDLSKADVSLNIFCWLEAQQVNKTIEYSCSIGDDRIGNLSYNDIITTARNYIKYIGGFEKFAEWGLIKP